MYFRVIENERGMDKYSIIPDMKKKKKRERERERERERFLYR